MQALAGWFWRLSGPVLVVAALICLGMGSRAPWPQPSRALVRPAASLRIAASRCSAAMAPPQLAASEPAVAAELLAQGLLPPACTPGK